MSPRRTSVPLPCLAVALAAALTGLARAAHAERPNVLVVSIDSLRRDALGCYGARLRYAPGVSPTPNLDRLATAGVRLSDAYAPSPWTLPSHASLFTGLSPLVHRVETDVQELEADTTTLAEMLRAAGYHTAGVFSGPYLEPVWGLGRGFERYHAAYGSGVTAASALVGRLDRYIADAVRVDDAATVEELRWLRRAEYERVRSLSHADVSSERVTPKALEELDHLVDANAPWFLFVHYFDVHYDYVPPPPFDRTFDPDYGGYLTGRGFMTNIEIAVRDPGSMDEYARRVSDRDLDHIRALYAGEVAWVDEHVGRLLSRLDEKGVASRTLVVVLSDHGDEFFEHGGIGHRRNVAEEVIRVPVLLRLPGSLPAGHVEPGLVSLTDIPPTVLELAGLPVPASLTGRSILPLGKGQENGETRPLLSRLVRIYDATARVASSDAPIAVRVATVQEAFRFGSIKIVRRRRWPLIPPRLADAERAALQNQANRDFRREDLGWIDLARFPDEPTAAYSADFRNPAAHRALGAVRRRYRHLQATRALIAPDAPLQADLRAKLESLGYLDDSPAPTSPREGFVLPAPADRRAAAPN
jgi:arylsulfatase A-like enzyme